MNTAPAVSVKRPLARVKDVAELLNVQPSTVYEWAAIDYIPCIRFGTGKVKPCLRFDLDAVQAWVTQRVNEGRTSRVPQFA